MKQRLASLTLACAVLACWGGVWVAQGVKEARNDVQLSVIPVADLSGVTRVVWDVALPDHRSRADVDTLVLAGWTGDLRLSTLSTSKRTLPLKLVREGNTVYVRAGEAANRQRAANQAPMLPALPASLALPASITELVWPSTRLVMSSRADMPALTIRSQYIEITTEPRDKNRRAQRGVDSLVEADLIGDEIPGKLGHLTAMNMLAGGCAKSDAQLDKQQSGIFALEGGFYEKLTVVTREGKVRLLALQPNTRVDLFANAATSMDLSNLSFLDQVSIHKLSAEQSAQLVPTLAPHQKQACLSSPPDKRTGE